MSDDDDDGPDRTLGPGVAAFVAVHLLALPVLGDPSLPALLVVEAVAVGSLLAGDALATDGRTALLAAGVVLAALCAVGVALGSGVSPWAVAVGLLVGAGAARYAGHAYDRSVTGGDPA